MARRDEPQAPLVEYFDADDKGDNWELWCKRCDLRWELSKDNAKDPRYLLRLLDHCRMHVALELDRG